MKLYCRIFGHKYRPGQGEFVHVVDDVFRITQCCVLCGKKTCCLVHIPLPEPVKEYGGYHEITDDDALEEIKETEE